MKQPKSGGGWQAIRYTVRKARSVGMLRFWRAMRSKNACKTCAFGMGGQAGGMTNEAGHFPEVCKKSMQAMAADMAGRIEPRFFESYSLDQLKSFTSRELEALGRIVEPVIAEPGCDRYRPISWEEAFNHISEALSRTAPERSFFYSSGRSSNEAGFLMQLMARCYGTNHVNNCSYYCHQASGVGLRESIGTGTATVELKDLDKCDLVFVIGANPSSNHPRLMTTLMNLRKRGGKVIVVNPLREVGLESFRVPSSAKSLLFGSEIASTYVQPVIGGDCALFAGIAKALLAGSSTFQKGGQFLEPTKPLPLPSAGEDGELANRERGLRHGKTSLEERAIDPLVFDFISTRTEGFEELKTLLQTITWSEIEEQSGLSQEEIESVAKEYAQAKSVIFSWSMGITQHEHGVENVQWIVNLALLRGMVGREGAGLMPIRGHSNVQGLGSIGVTPEVKEAVLKNLEQEGIKVPDFKGHDTMSALEAAARNEVDFAFCLGGNIFGASPDADFVSAAMAKIDTVVYLSTTLNTGHVSGRGKTTIILPVKARDEESQSTTQESMFNFVRLSDGGPARHEGPMSEVEVISAIAGRTLPKSAVDWDKMRDHDGIRQMIARVIPGFDAAVTIGETKKEFHIPGRILHQPKFNTPDGKAHFKPLTLPKLEPLAENEMRLMTMRSEGQFNTVVYEEEDLYRGQERRDVILINPADMEKLGVATDERVIVGNDLGEMAVIARPFDIAKGCCAMYYPEANILIPRRVDPRSHTPAFKSAKVRIVKQAGSDRESRK